MLLRDALGVGLVAGQDSLFAVFGGCGCMEGCVVRGEGSVTGDGC